MVNNNVYVSSCPSDPGQWPCSESMSQLDRGFSYVCEPEQLRASVGHAPDLADRNGNWPELLRNPEAVQQNPA